MVEIQLMSRFGQWAMSKQKFEARCSASEMLSVLSSRSIRYFQTRSAADLMVSYRTSDMKYTDTIKVTEDSIYSHPAENGAVESGRPLGRQRSTMSCHLNFTLENVNRNRKKRSCTK
jgi:hypothetical protein